MASEDIENYSSKKQHSHQKSTKNRRLPLKTLNSQEGPSNIMVKGSAYTPMKLDTKFLTFRKTYEDNCLDLFRYDYSRDFVSLTDDENVAANTAPKFNNCDVVEISDCSTDPEQTVKSDKKEKKTPKELSPAENIRVKNIKRSLKRPHSRELQGISPTNDKKIDKAELESNARRKLSFRSEFCHGVGFSNNEYDTLGLSIVKAYGKDIFKYLLKQEICLGSSLKVPKIARTCVINWLMKVHGAEGDPAIIQSACWFLDSILKREGVLVEKLQLIASGCYWISQKFYQPNTPSTKLVRCSDNAFQTSDLVKAEQLIMNFLRFPVKPVVAQDFISYLAWYCNVEFWTHVEFAASFIAMCGLLAYTDLCCDYPSVVAAAAVRNALLLMDMTDKIPLLTSCPIYVAAVMKAQNFNGTMSAQRIAVNTVSSASYKYNAIVEQSNVQRMYIVNQIIKSVSQQV